MNIRIHYPQFPRTEALDEYVRTELNDALERFTTHDLLKIEVWLKVENAKRNRGRDEFVCEIAAVARDGTRMRIKDKRVNLYAAVYWAFRRLTTLQHRQNHKKVDQSKRASVLLRRPLRGFA